MSTNVNKFFAGMFIFAVHCIYGMEDQGSSVEESTRFRTVQKAQRNNNKPANEVQTEETIYRQPNSMTMSTDNLALMLMIAKAKAKERDFECGFCCGMLAVLGIEAFVASARLYKDKQI